MRFNVRSGGLWVLIVSDNDPVTYTDTGADKSIAGFPQRLARLVAGGSMRGFARKAGVSDTFLRQCLSGRTEPTRTKLIALAEAGGCSVQWLATGSPENHLVAEDAAANPASRIVDPLLLRAILASVEEVLAEHGHTLDPDRKAFLIAALYDMHHGQDNPSVSPDQVVSLLSRTG